MDQNQIYGGYIGEYFELPRLTFSKVSVTVQGTPSTGSGERRKALTSPVPT
jgi:hypothetical protein